MKNIFLYTLLALFGLSTTGCKKYLEVEPTNVRAFATYDDAVSMLSGYLRIFTAVSATTDDMKGVTIPWRNVNSYMYFNYLADVLDTDYVLMSKAGYINNSHDFATLYRESLNWRNPTMPGVLWDEYYLNIGFLNTVIDGTALVKATQAEKDVVVMEAKFLRAWYVFKLMQYFAPYKIDRLGLPLNFDSQAVGGYNRSRKTQTECYRIIIDELTEVLDCTTPPLAGLNIFYNKDLVNALLAQVYHFKGGSGAAAADDYDNAIEYAGKVLDKYPLPAKADYVPIPEVPASTYGIFVCVGNQPALISAYSNTNRSFYSMPTFVQVTDEFYGLFSDDDVRKVPYFWVTSMSVSYDRAIRKFIRTSLTDPTVQDKTMKFNFFHLADMHLIIAECLALKNDPAASTWLEDFRKERYDNYTPWTGDVLDGILLERRKEFAFEYDMRWLDLRRYPKGWTRKSFQDEENPTYTIAADDYRWCLPIPVAEELQYNNIEQNPGWGMF